MRTYLECLTCLTKQAVEIARQNIHPDHQEDFVRDALKKLTEFDYTNPPPIMAMELYAMLRDVAGLDDPYAQIKSRYNKQALELYPELKKTLEDSADPLHTAVRIAVAGNIIDFGAGNSDTIHVEETLDRALRTPFAIDHMDQLREDLDQARSILYLADNAGEIVFDRVLIEELGARRVTCAVRDIPVINDATLHDAVQAGLVDVCRVISSGSPAPGTPLAICSGEFKDLFYGADIVISKGQGNFETLTHPGREIFFLFMVKCPIISQEVGVEINSFITMKRS